MEFSSNLLAIVPVAVAIIVAITFHEAAHGIVAYRLGDDTAYRQGRVTLNPLRHIDAFGTVLLPAILVMTTGFLFGWAKPVPVNFGRLRNPRRDMVLVAAAGPAMNVVLAWVSALLMHLALALPDPAGQILLEGLSVSIFINLILAVFNMLPLPPLDGGRVAVGLLPDRLAFLLARLERFGLLIIVGLILLPRLLGDMIGANLDVFSAVIWPAVDYLSGRVLFLAGLG